MTQATARSLGGPAALESMELDAIVRECCADVPAIARGPSGRRLPLPSREAVVEAVEALRAAMFPGHSGAFDAADERLRYQVGASLARTLPELERQVRRAIAFTERHDGDVCSHCQGAAAAAARAFLVRLPALRRLVLSDVDAAFDGDPALHSRDEAIVSYPGIRALFSQRLAHELHELSVPLVPRIVTEHAHAQTGIDIHPGARIGPRFFVDHGTGVVVGETAVIGASVRMYQGVTLGARSFPLDEHGNPVKGIARHPIIEDEVVIYAGATILGRITVGRGSAIGGNVWITRDVPAGSRVTQPGPP